MIEPHKIKAKLDHFFGRTFGVWITPVEFLWLAGQYGVHAKDRDVAFARQQKELGKGGANWYYVQIDEPSDFLGRH